MTLICKFFIPVMLAFLMCSCGFLPADPTGEDNTSNIGSAAESDSAVEKTVTSYIDPAAPEDGGISIESETAGTILDYFAEIAFGSEFGQSSKKLCRWEDEILYTVSGDPRKSDTELVEILADKLNTIEGFPGIREASAIEKPNFEIMFITRHEIMEQFDDANESCKGMSEYHWYTDTCEIFKARAAIDSEAEEERESTICEELLQSLGLAMDSYTHKDSVFYQGMCIYTRPSKLDWAMVELLYHPDLSAGMSRYEAIQTAAGVLKW